MSADKETTLAYADHVGQSLRATGAQLNRIMLLNILLSMILVGLTLGVVTTEEKLKISGISFSVKLSTLLAVGCGLSAIFMLSFRAFQRRELSLKNEFWRLFGSLDIEAPDRYNKDPYGSQTVVETLIEVATPEGKPLKGPATIRYISTVISTVVFLGGLVFPIVAQTITAIDIGNSADWSGASVALFAAPVVSLFALVGWWVD